MTTSDMSNVPTLETAERDRGSILTIVLVIVLALGLVVAALATYSASTLRFGRVVEDTTDRHAAADGAMDNALDDLGRGSSPCWLFANSSNPGGYTYSLGDQINGIEPTVNCTVTGGNVNAVDAFAVIMTGANGQSGPLLSVTNGGNSPQAQKVFEGPVYMARPPTNQGANPSTYFNATLTIKNGDLFYTGSCPDDPAVSLDPKLTIAPAGYGTRCETDDWFTLFSSRRPPEPAVNTLPVQPSTTPSPVGGCHVWEAGIYSSPPQLANQSYNYFKSGNYYFADMGTWSISNAYVLAGYPGPSGLSIPGFKNNDVAANNPCNFAWSNDVSTAGATFYMGGNSKINLDQNSALEVSGSAQGSYNVGIQALETQGTPSNLGGDDRIVRSGPGTNKQLSVQGLVWAPNTGFEFDLIANDAVAALTGGAVVSELVAGASAQANNFLISVDTQPSEASFRFTSTAANSGTTSIRTNLTYRTGGFYAVTSRRVLNITPE